jgi:hypothetical protein
MATAAACHFGYSPIPAPASANLAYFKDFGRRVDGFDPANVTGEQMNEIMDMLYKVRVWGTFTGETR